MEETLVTRAGIRFEAIPAAGLHGVEVTKLPGNLLRLARGYAASRKILRRTQPDVLLFTGGYVGVPVELAGRSFRSLSYVPDIEPALALKVIQRWTDVVAVTTEDSRKYYKAGQRVVVTGYPTRSDLKRRDRETSRRSLGLRSEGKVLLVMGGSLGARSINQAIWACLAEVLELAQVIHLTGELDWSEVEGVRAGLPAGKVEDYHPYPYLHEEMAQVFSAANLVVSRAGASTLGELPLMGLPAILVPYPHAWRFQEVNANYLAERGGAIVLEDERLLFELFPILSELIQDDDRLRRMAIAMESLARRSAAESIAAEIVRLSEG